MATLRDGLERWPVRWAEAEWNGLHLTVGHADERRNGKDWEGWDVRATHAYNGSLVAGASLDTVEDVEAWLADAPIGLPTSFAGWYWVGYDGERHEEG